MTAAAARRPACLDGRHHRRRARPRGAFTLIEVLIAAVVLTVGLAIALQSIGSALSASARTARRAGATALAADRLAIAAAADAATPDGGETREGVTYRWEVETVAQGDGVDELTCTVTWRDAHGGGEVSLARRAWTGGQP